MFESKTLAMRRLMLLVSHGNHWWTWGQVPIGRFREMEKRLIERYAIDRNSQQRYRAAKQSKANCHCVAYLGDDKIVKFWLVGTEGSGLLFQVEKMQNALERESRLTTFHDEQPEYELVLIPRKGRPEQWTWQMCKPKYAEWKDRIEHAIRHQGDTLLSQAIYSLKRIPPFHMTRRQAFNLYRGAQMEWKRTRRGAFPHPDFYVGWVGRFK